jgi:hypothetical protein
VVAMCSPSAIVLSMLTSSMSVIEEVRATRMPKR